MNDNRPPLEWKTVHEIKGEEGHTLRVQRRGDRRPQYSYHIGRERRQEPGEPANDRLLPFVQVRVQAQGAVTVDRSSLKMVEQALDWIAEDAAKFEDAYITGMQEREERRSWNGNSHADDVRHTGKTERNRNKRKGHG